MHMWVGGEDHEAITHTERLPNPSLHTIRCEMIGLNGKFLRFSNEKSIIFLNVFTIFNQLYNFHCLLLPSPNMSQGFQFRPCKNFLVLIQNMLG
jgi:hypothetical protein